VIRDLEEFPKIPANIYGLTSKHSWRKSEILDNHNHREIFWSPLSKTYYDIATDPSHRLTDIQWDIPYPELKVFNPGA